MRYKATGISAWEDSLYSFTGHILQVTCTGHCFIDSLVNQVICPHLKITFWIRIRARRRTQFCLIISSTVTCILTCGMWPAKNTCRGSITIIGIIGTTWPGYVGVIMNLQIVLNAQKNPFLNQATRKKKYLPKFCNPKESRNWNFHSQKLLWSSLSLEICSIPPGGGAAVWNLEPF